MDFNEYQNRAKETAMYPSAGNNFIYPVLGLAGETGEVVEKFKKLMRDSNVVTVADMTELQKEGIAKELGDMLWYIAQIGTELGVTLEDIVAMNLKKIQVRKEQGRLHGEGDNR
jgi:NTP pyrophosphatase (non-canonical NTP hydrolase)